MQLTYQQQLALVEAKLATVSVNGKFSTFKYAKKVMYDYLWDKHPELKYCRGHTYDNTNGKPVTIPPTKTFNYLENDTWEDVPLDTRVFAYKKYNGFMAASSIYEGELIVSTTGSTKSDYARLAYEELAPMIPTGNNEGCSWLFEICHPSDPHIVDDGNNVYYLGCTLHSGAGSLVFQPAGNFIDSTLGAMLELVKQDKGEGYMLYTNDMQCCKLKTPYYSGKKYLMRMSKTKVQSMYINHKFAVDHLPDCWKHAPEIIVSNFSDLDWTNMNDQQRRNYLETIEL